MTANWRKILKSKKLLGRLMLVSGGLYLVSYAIDDRRPYTLLTGVYELAAGALILKESREQVELETAG